tara:strand:- start:11142 stop:11552 length:411 start_codon:yes stop_codon:yes gene_type:complete
MNQMQFELTNTQPEDQTVTQWVKWYDNVKNVGDRFTIKADKVIFKEDSQPVFFVIDEESNQGISVFAEHHPNAQFTDATPHGIRFANAILRAFSITGSVSAEELCEYINEHDDSTVVIEKTEKGVLWTIDLKKSKK